MGLDMNTSSSTAAHEGFKTVHSLMLVEEASIFQRNEQMGCTIFCSSDVGVDLVFDGFIREAQALMVSDTHVPQFLLDLQQEYLLSMIDALSLAHQLLL